MGTDIHQKNLIFSKKDQIYYFMDDIIDNSFENMYYPNLVDYRCYDIFGLLAGVRSDYFEIISENRHEEIPAETPLYFRNMLSSDYHSFTWYYYKDLVIEIDKKVKEITDFLKSIQVNEDNYNDYEYEENTLALVKEILAKLKKYKTIYDNFNHSKIFDLDKMKILFYFDS